jgi:hypothetical protein
VFKAASLRDMLKCQAVPLEIPTQMPTSMKTLLNGRISEELKNCHSLRGEGSQAFSSNGFLRCMGGEDVRIMQLRFSQHLSLSLVVNLPLF